MTIIFISFENPVYCCQMIKNIFGPNTSLMEKSFTTLKIHNHQHDHNIM
jgi:hypothetical protein